MSQLANRRAKLLIAIALILLFGGAVSADSATATQTASVTLSPIGKLTSVPASVTLLQGSAFGPFAGSVTISNRIRTSPAGGSSLQLQVTSDFTPANGPSAASGNLTYTCSGATLGTPCAGTVTALTSGQTTVTSFPASACTGGGTPCSSTNPNSVAVNFNVSDKATFQATSYAASITFTLSAI